MASPFVRIAKILKRSIRGDNPLRYDGTVNVADHVELSDIIMKQETNVTQKNLSFLANLKETLYICTEN
jgi:hypothetical protein